MINYSYSKEQIEQNERVRKESDKFNPWPAAIMWGIAVFCFMISLQPN